MRNPFRRNKNNHIGPLQLTRVNAFTCSHYKNIFDYGAHPKRVFGACLDCKQFALLSWSDPYGRITNRIIGLLPAIWSLVILVVTLIIIVIAIIPYLPRA